MDQPFPVGGWASIYFGVHHRLQCLDHVKNLKFHLSETWILQRGWHCMMLPLAGERIDSQAIAPWSLNCSCWHKAACWVKRRLLSPHGQCRMVPLIVLKVRPSCNPLGKFYGSQSASPYFGRFFSPSKKVFSCPTQSPPHKFWFCVGKTPKWFFHWNRQMGDQPYLPLKMAWKPGDPLPSNGFP
jgi:hypothetical protein